MTKNTKRQKARNKKQEQLLSPRLFLTILSVLSRPLPIAYCLLLIALLSCENDPGVVNGDNDRKPNIEEVIKVESLLSQNGSLRAKLVSPFMLRYSLDTSYLEFPRTLHVNFYDSTGKIESQLDARYGKYLETRSLVFLRDSVVVFNIKGDTLWAPELWWDQSAKKFYTDKRVRIQRKDQRVIGGRGMEATQDLDDITIFQIESPSFITVPDSMQVD